MTRPRRRPTSRRELVARARALKAEIDQHFTDLVHWNTHVRPATEPPINPDPDGRLRRMARELDGLIAQGRP